MNGKFQGKNKIVLYMYKFDILKFFVDQPPTLNLLLKVLCVHAKGGCH